jgi:BirA family transcriptional regulator, biotin operon repressor / biotin---[acetyl-CoA-carboxylase] ligase
MAAAKQTEWPALGRQVGRRVLIFDQLDSTNTFAAGLAQDPANAGTVVLAREQTAGRGQHGRSWACPPGAGVLLSALLFPTPELRRPALLTAWVAVAVCETIRQLTGQMARIKWPNDVLVKGRKVCGILIEQGKGTVAGLGLNVNQTAEMFEATELPQAGSLAMLTGKPHDWDQVVRQLIGTLDEEYIRLLEGDLATLESRWKWYLGLLGRAVKAECHGEMQRGRLVEVGWEGVQIEQASGELISLLPERVLHLEPDQ